ncbi:MAG: UDP-3-O-(3-hydroxymyristoyl)glucosamine N-acyltransferase [Candidatus Aureabacteria bacterium]|nr:UDP-3-O-(3-hydroxymyristoyl)glucosamine N-acyltransferase [Candidatus Auribacterota bacterium]
MKKTLKEIAALIGGRVEGDGDVVITGASGIKEAREGDLTFLANPKYASLLKETRAAAVVIEEGLQVAPGKPLIRVKNPSIAFSKLIDLLGPKKLVFPEGVHTLAVVSPKAKLGKGVSVGPFAVIEDGAVIGDRAVIRSGVYVGHGAAIGAECHLYPHVIIREGCEIGSRVIIHGGTVIGSDGFGYVAVEGIHHKIPQVGKVVIEDDVEIGSNVTIDRARFDKTIIRKGTKIDNLVQIAHNCDIGENSIIVAQVGISGSTTIGKNVILAGQVGVVGHVTIGDNSIIGAKGGVSKSVPPNSYHIGIPAMDATQFKKIFAAYMRLPQLVTRVRELEAKLAALEGRPADDHAEATND